VLLPGQTPFEGRIIAGLRERKRAANRAATVDAAYALFVERGYDRVTVGDICEAADIAPRTFFRYFAGKEDVVAEPFHRLAEEILDGISAAPPESLDTEALADALRRVGAAAVADREKLSAFLVVVRGSVHPEMVRFLPLGEQERDMARRLARRHSISAEPDRRLRLLVAVSLAAYRVWFEDMISGPLADPLGDLDKILRAVLRLAEPADPAAGDNPGAGRD
jgi:AcrR family transcriptional regulator